MVGRHTSMFQSGADRFRPDGRGCFTGEIARRCCARRRAARLLLLLGLLLASVSLVRNVQAQVQADLRWVEVEAALSPDGKAMVQYKVRWNVQRGTMGGFYFQGEQGSIQWHRPGCGAVVNGQRRYDLDLVDLGNRWDVLLADGQRYGPGEITYVFTYFTDYAAAGHLANTTSPELGELVVFNWAPVQWDEEIEHQTVLVRWPIKVDKPELTLDEVTEVGLRTEQFVNERYKLSYLGLRGTAVSPPVEPPEGDRYLVVRAHKDVVGNREKMQLTYYVPADSFSDAPLPTREPTSCEASVDSNTTS